jgi:hypothetical protein
MATGSSIALAAAPPQPMPRTHGSRHATDASRHGRHGSRHVLVPWAAASRRLGRVKFPAVRRRLGAPVRLAPGVTVGHTVTLSAPVLLTAVRGGRLAYRWTIVSRPRGSRAGLHQADSAHPSLRPDRPGRYVMRVRIGRSVTRTLTLTASVAAGPLGVALYTIWNDDGNWGVQVGGQGAPGAEFYGSPTQSDALQLLALDRQTLAPVGKRVIRQRPRRCGPAAGGGPEAHIQRSRDHHQGGSGGDQQR